MTDDVAGAEGAFEAVLAPLGQVRSRRGVAGGAAFADFRVVEAVAPFDPDAALSDRFAGALDDLDVDGWAGAGLDSPTTASVSCTGRSKLAATSGAAGVVADEAEVAAAAGTTVVLWRDAR